ncbi:MAG: phosphocholine cytidylyltransferase family protein [Clostridiaceae bacterium]|jgi:2-aminoethylphosphonate-pyruvate transaminase|nr:phosphocholine cytidylyltransferase family protein [Clostridiaceae bacterium]
MVKTAVILAAGMGSRLGDFANNQPKGFLDVGGIRLIDRSVDALLSAGIEDIVIGTGFRAIEYDNYAASRPQIRCVRNDAFQGTGSMETLYRLRMAVPGDFLLLESDLLYDPAGITTLMEDPRDNVLLASGPTQSSDEVFIETDQSGCLVDMSKHRETLSAVHAELVGITKVSEAFFALMCDLYSKGGTPKADYESLIVAAGRREPMHVRIMDDFVWCEIDDIHHMERAIGTILPKLQNRG